MQLDLKNVESDALKALIELEQICDPNPWGENNWKPLLKSSGLWLRGGYLCKNLLAYVCVKIQGDQAELWKIGVHPDFRRQGLGQKVLSEVLNDLKQVGVEELFLELRENNEPALGLYLTLGFKVIDTRKKYYDNGENALLMRRVL